MAHKSNKKDKKDKSRVCQFCGGSGKVHLRCDDVDILGSKVMELLCPICHGSGRVGTQLQPMYLRFRQLPRMLLQAGRSRSRQLPGRLPIPRGQGHGGRLSRSRRLLLLPGTPLAGYQEGDTVPKSSPESAYPYADLRYPIFDYRKKKDDDEEPDEDREDEPIRNESEIILRLPDGITIGQEFPSNLVLDPDFTTINFQEGLEAGSEPVTARIVYGAKSDECLEVLLREINPLRGEPAVLELKSGDGIFDLDGELSTVSKDEVFVFENKDRLLAVEPYQAHIETDISGSGAVSGLEIENVPGGQLTLSPHQSNSAASMDVLGPAMSGQVNPLDVTGVEDPVGFDINTDVTGDAGF